MQRHAWSLIVFATLSYWICAFFAPNLFDNASIPGYIMVWTAVYGIASFSFLFSCWLSLFRWRTQGLASLLPLLTILGLSLITIFVDFRSLWLHFYFSAGKDAREQVASLIAKGELKRKMADRSNLIQLTGWARQLSIGGEVLVLDEGVFFYTYRGILNGFDGFYYAPIDAPPKDRGLQSEIRQIQKLTMNWYYITGD